MRSFNSSIFPGDPKFINIGKASDISPINSWPVEPFIVILEF